jgi:hypothetical protein
LCQTSAYARLDQCGDKRELLSQGFILTPVIGFFHPVFMHVIDTNAFYRLSTSFARRNAKLIS